MLHEVAPPLAERIAAIEARGIGHLRAVDRQAATRAALAVALPAAVAVPALAFALGWFAPLRWEVVGLAALLVPAIAYAGMFLRERRRQQVSRRAAIQLFDRTLGLKDRIATTDEFLRRPAPTPFQRAAMGEAAPWIARATTAPLPAPPAPPGKWRRWPFVAAGLALLAGTIAQQRLYPAGGAGGAVAEALTRAGIATAAPPPESARQDGDARSATGRPSASLPGSGDTSRAAGLPGTPAGEAGRPNDGAGIARPGSGAASRAQGFDTPGAPQAGGAPAGQPGSARQATSGARGGTGKDGERAGAAQDGRAAAGDRAGADRAAPDGEANRQGGNTPQPGTAGTAPPPSASPLASQQRPPSSRGGNGNQPPSQGRSQQNQSGQTQPGQGKGQGRNGQKTGQDALKRSNGIAALLLAVPMADRLGGTANPGLVSSQPRQVPPHAGASGSAIAGDRGTGTGDTGHLPHRPATPQDRRLVRDYFRPSGVRY
jgi:hypothetical protein